MRINAAAFDGASPQNESRLVTFGRNVLRGFCATQLALSVRRQFLLAEGLNLQTRADTFNLLNHPNFDNPAAILTDSNFGRATQMFGNGLGGPSALYHVGGP